jgi:hypothetical protein
MASSIEICTIKDKSLRFALYEAEECNRTPVTAKWLLEHPDVDGYIYLARNAELGLDPWLTIAGVDALTDGSQIILEHGRTGEMKVHPDFIVFVSKSVKDCD